MLKVYPAIFHEEEGAIWAEFPDLPGCQTCGAGIAETIALATDALGLYLNACRESGQAAPEPSSIQAIAAPADGFVSLVSCDPTRYEKRTRAVKKTLTIPEWLNDEAEKQNINFSSVLQQALIQKLQ